MSIVSSNITSDRDQGAYRKITCEHTDHLTAIHIERWKALPAENVELTKVERAVKFELSLANDEVINATEQELPIADGDYSDKEAVAIAYLRKAYAIQDPLSSYKTYIIFNNWRVLNGWSTAQVETALVAYGLPQTEWDLIYARYNYLQLPARVDVLTSYQTIINNDLLGG